MQTAESIAFYVQVKLNQYFHFVVDRKFNSSSKIFYSSFHSSYGHKSTFMQIEWIQIIWLADDE